MPTGQRRVTAVTIATGLGDTQQALLRCMDDRQARTTVEAAAHAGLDSDAAAKAMTRLHAHWYVEPVPPRRWVITEEGRVAIEILRAWDFLALQRRRPVRR